MTYDEIIERAITLGQAREDIRGLIVLGSRARTDRPADEWSDLDLVIITTDPDIYLRETDWLTQFGPYWADFIDRQATDTGFERRILFENALDVDFIPITSDMIKAPIEAFPREVIAVFRRGFRIVLDKDDFGAHLTHLVQDSQPTPKQLPSESEFLALWNDFFYHAVWTAKKLRRGELWTAKGCLDNSMKWQLLRLIEWHARSLHGVEYDTWHNGRFLEKWADPRVVEGLHQAFARFDLVDQQQALIATLDLFRWVSREIADRLSFAYPTEADEQITEWISQCVSHDGQSKNR
jgi:aminoglycoside 6-adenylyltransferase